MTEQEAQAIITEIRTVNPQMRQGKTLYRINSSLQAKGLPCIEVYRLTKKHAIFERMIAFDYYYLHPDVRRWLDSRK